MSFVPIHRHLLVSSICMKPPKTRHHVSQFLKKVVETVGMEIIAGPITAQVTEEGNRGPTGAVVLATSHSSIHSWVETGRVEFDIYSCCHFEVEPVLNLFDQFKPTFIKQQLINRDNLK